MRFLIILLLCVCTGCATTYDVKRCEGIVCAEAHISSRREFDQVSVEYIRETGTFKFSAGAVDQAVSPVETAAAQILLQLPTLLAPVPIP